MYACMCAHGWLVDRVDVSGRLSLSLNSSHSTRTNQPTKPTTGMNRNVHEEDLRELFGKFGRIVEVRIMFDRYSRQHKGYGFIRYKVRLFLSCVAGGAVHALVFCWP